ncbi:hypothetical protein BT63DRAFT_77504 [Microthyrium microscopicum]|uniref:Uncharacterized protein n=1 Tax=Microthyrium microscopicum TaxID=703497 RepID=A0A6A6U0Q4_9PEZI|nr:hypothetical protein BT63DRAFT_77504 [Microthyrium microscopicum]
MRGRLSKLKKYKKCSFSLMERFKSHNHFKSIPLQDIQSTFLVLPSIPAIQTTMLFQTFALCAAMLAGLSAACTPGAYACCKCFICNELPKLTGN